MTNSAKKLIAVLICSIFAGELVIMLVLSSVTQLPVWAENLLDAVALSIFCAPLLYFYVFRPMSQHIADLKRVEAELRVSAAAFETHDAIMITDANANIVRVNKAFELTTGYTEAEVLGKNPSILKSGHHNQAFFKKMWEALLTHGVWSGEIWDRSKGGDVYPKQSTITAVKNDQGDITQYVAVFTNITDRKKAENEIYNLAFYDALTGLPNRRLLVDRLKVALSVSGRTRKYGALLFLDLDNFKTLNDSLGHEYGDLLLVEVANRLRYSVREVDTVARLGGDEFVLLLENISVDEQDASQKVSIIAEKIRSILAKPYRLKEHIRHSTPSIGVCLYFDQNDLAEELLKRADMAMYQAKNSGRNKVRFFDPMMQKVMEKRAALESDLRIALAENQLELHYQIQLDGNRNPIGAEALIRWKHPERGYVSPAEFIPIAEESSMILDIGNWVLNAACCQIAEWKNHAQTEALVLAVNISAQQFMQPDFVDTVACAIQKHGISGRNLKLELTESVVLDDLNSVVKKMLLLRSSLGVSISLDDFGTGYSSLAYLKQLPLDQIKIDQSFVRDMTTDASDAMMVKNIIDMAHNFGLNVIAEGVETEDQLSLLKKNGCMSYQGYLFSKPIPAEQFASYLNEYLLVAH